MEISLQATGFREAADRLRAIQAAIPACLHAATAEALEFLEGAAQRILDAEVYDKTRPEFAPPLDKNAADSLYQAFTRALEATGAAAVRGTLANTSGHAGFLEWGTDDEGTGHHFVGPAAGAALKWIDPRTGAEVYDKGHEVSGIHPIRFMQRALEGNREAVADIYRRHFRGLFG